MYQSLAHLTTTPSTQALLRAASLIPGRCAPLRTAWPHGQADRLGVNQVVHHLTRPRKGFMHLPSGKLTCCYGKSPENFLAG